MIVTDYAVRPISPRGSVCLSALTSGSKTDREHILAETYSTEGLWKPVPTCKKETSAIEFLHWANKASVTYAFSKIKTPSVTTTIAEKWKHKQLIVKAGNKFST